MDEAIRQAANTLAGAEVRSLAAIRRGGNSQIYRVNTAAGHFALKVYPDRGGDTRDRGDVEWRALQFLSAQGVAGVPQPLARDPTGRFLLMEWVEGSPVGAHTSDDLTQAADFVATIFALSAHPDAVALPPASEACLSAGDIVRQIEARLARLVPQPHLDGFLDRNFRPLLEKAKAAAASDAQYDAPLPMDLRRLIPADFGFHNALRQGDGRLRFVDFEYFGWDDPVKLTADFILHPAMELTASDRCYFIGRMAAVLPEDRLFASRLKRLLPLFALRWILILLNPFRDDRRVSPAIADRSQQKMLEDRLTKAQTLCEWAGDGTRAVGRPGPRTGVDAPATDR